MRYLLDTNICIEIARSRPAKVLARFERLRPGDVGMSIVTNLELVYGAWKSERRQENLSRVEELAKLIPVRLLELDAADHYGRLRATLGHKGVSIGAYDLLIAAHALSLGLTLVTSNAREFSRVEGLRIENWAG